MGGRNVAQPSRVSQPENPHRDGFRSRPHAESGAGEIGIRLSRFHLRGVASNRIRAGMNLRGPLVLAVVVSLGACREDAEIVVTETRRATTKDESPKLFATSDERFRNAKPSPIRGELPDAWREVPSSQFRLLNYRFGETGMGEVWVSIASGTVLDNVNRWLEQFAVSKVDSAGLAAMRTIPIMGADGVWVEAEGEYISGMGSPPQPGFGLAGVVASRGGQIVTVKMVGPRAEVEAAKPTLEAFVATLRAVE
jgi:hypothetical protein